MYGDRLEQGIRNYFHEEVSKVEPSREWWDNAVSRLRDSKHRKRLWFVPSIRLAGALLPLVLLIIGGTVYGATLLIREFYWKHIEEAGLAQELNLSQTIDGITVTVERSYADSNVVLIGYTVSGSASQYYTDTSSLSTVDGQVLPAMIGAGGVPSSNTLGDWRPSERTAIVTAYDTSSLTGLSSELHLRLEIQVTESPERVNDTTGPFIFEFSVPFHTGKAITSGQSVESAGVLITLEKVIITTWATRTILVFQPNENRYLPVISIRLPDGHIQNAWVIQDEGTSSEQFTIGDFTSQSGEWELTINELVVLPGAPRQEDGGYQASDTERITGTWIFHFQVP